jgi:hypothetical protein
MGRTVARITRGTALLALLSAAAAASAQIPIRVDSVRVVEQSSGVWLLQIPVRLTGPAPSMITVNWTTLPGSALPGSDYTTASGMATFNIGQDTQMIPVQINGDIASEWSPTQMLDEVFFVDLDSPTGPAFIEKGRGTVTLLDDDHPTVNQRPGVQFLTALSDSVAPHASNNGRNRLQWRIPAAESPVTDVVVRWNLGPSCTFPVSTTDGVGGTPMGTAPGAGQVQTWSHSGRNFAEQHCYSVFAIYGAGPTTEIAQVKATPFNSSLSVAWSYASGAASVVPPTVGADAIYTVDNRGVVHAMRRGVSGGLWPSSWNPVSVGKPTQNRSAAVPYAGGWRLLLGTDGGGVHAVDGSVGSVIWSRSTAFGTALPSLGGTQAQPAALFVAFGGNNDMLLMGSNTSANQFFALDPKDGATIDSIGVPGAVLGMAAVDYAANRVYFGTTSSSATLVAMDLGPSGTPGLDLSGPTWNPKPMGPGSNGAPTLRNGRVYLGDIAGEIHALHVTGGTEGTSYSQSTGDGQAKGFLWPDRRDDRLYFATDTKVHAVRDTGTAFTPPIWQVPLTSPSMVLQWPGTDHLFVGDGNGRLVQINVADQTQKTIVLESGSQIGAPSLDGGNSLVMVGSSSGTVYAVRVPLP